MNGYWVQESAGVLSGIPYTPHILGSFFPHHRRFQECDHVGSSGPGPVCLDHLGQKLQELNGWDRTAQDQIQGGRRPSGALGLAFTGANRVSRSH